MTKDEALRLALEALDNDSDSDDAWHQRLDAKTAIKEALAAPAAQPAPVQPVALLNEIERYEPEIFREDRIRMELDKTGEWVKYTDVVTLLSTPPAAQRPWIGLTADEQISAARKFRDAPVALVCAIEAKLKEKNT